MSDKYNNIVNRTDRFRGTRRYERLGRQEEIVTEVYRVALPCGCNKGVVDRYGGISSLDEGLFCACCGSTPNNMDDIVGNGR